MTSKTLSAFLFFASIVCIASGCAPEGHTRYANIKVGGIAPSPPSAPAALNDAPPAIVTVWLSSVTVRPMQMWAAQVTTSTNVASVEMRTENFSVNMPRLTFGQFAFRYMVPDVAPIARRGYTLEIIARNSAGVEQIETVPFALK